MPYVKSKMAQVRIELGPGFSFWGLTRSFNSILSMRENGSELQKIFHLSSLLSVRDCHGKEYHCVHACNVLHSQAGHPCGLKPASALCPSPGGCNSSLPARILKEKSKGAKFPFKA